MTEIKISIDGESNATYIRFSNKQIVSTKNLKIENLIAAIDYDDREQLVGLEIIGPHSIKLD